MKYVRNKRKQLECVTELDRDAARECLLQLQAASWWEWRSGSRPMFWNFPDDQQVTMRDGIMLWMNGRMDPWLIPHDCHGIWQTFRKLLRNYASRKKISAWFLPSYPFAKCQKV
jgi:hypothetical protein